MDAVFFYAYLRSFVRLLRCRQTVPLRDKNSKSLEFLATPSDAVRDFPILPSAGTEFPTLCCCLTRFGAVSGRNTAY